MRILQLSNKAPYPTNDGSSIAIYTLAEGIADAGVELHLLTINTKKHFKPDDTVPVNFKEKTHYRSVYQNTDTTFIGAFKNLFSKHSYFVSRFFFKEFKKALFNTLKETTFDIIQLEGVFMASYIPAIKHYSKAKIVIRTHNLEHQIWERHLVNEKNLLKKIYLTLQNNRLKKFELNAFSEADAIVTITEEDKKSMALLTNKTPLYTCLTGINLTDYKPVHEPKFPGTVFHFASMDWMPNEEAVDWLLDTVWNDVLKQQPGAKLILAGRGMPAKFKRLASNTIIIKENVKSSPEFYSEHDIMLVPLWSGSGLRIKLVEGLAYGKPIITTSIGAEGIPYTNGKHLIIADTKKEFSDAIVSLLTDSSKKQMLQSNARKLAEEQFNYKTIAADLILFYKSLR